MILDQCSPEMAAAITEATGLQSHCYHTGGGCMVLEVDLTQDGRFLGPVMWLTREGSDWYVGFYDFATDPDDEGVCLSLPSTWNHAHGPYDPEDPEGFTANGPAWVASRVADVLRRVSSALHWQHV